MIDVNLPDSVITSVVEVILSVWSMLVQTKGQIIEVNVKNKVVTPIYSVENDVGSSI